MKTKAVMSFLGAIVVAQACSASRASVSAGTTSSQPTALSLAQRIEPSVRALAALGTGASVTVRRGDESITVNVGVTHADGASVGMSTRFNVASVSKLLTAAKIASLASEGRISLADSVHTLLPGVSIVDDAGTDHSTGISVEMLLRHVAGVPHQPGDFDPARIGSSWLATDLLTRMSDNWRIPLVGTPGTHRYSNLGYALLGAMIERRSGRTFSEAMTLFLSGVGMPTATFAPTDEMADMAWGVVSRDGTRAFNSPAWYLSRYSMPFTGLWTSTTELARFGQRMAQATRREDDPLHAMVERGSEGRGHGRGPIHGSLDGHATLEHDGGGPGFLAALIVVPDLDLSVAVACNGDGDDPAIAQRLGPNLRDVLRETLSSSSFHSP